MQSLSVTEGRLRALFAAGLAVTSELSLDALLHRLVEAAAELTGARYAALGVIDANGVELEQFITHGIDDDLRAEIAEPVDLAVISLPGELVLDRPCRRVRRRGDLRGRE